MNRRHYPYSAAKLGVLMLLALLGVALLSYVPSLAGRPALEGSLGVFFGLFVCAHPAANAVDLFFFRRHLPEELYTGWRGAGWLALNLATFFAGWLLVTVGATRLVGPRA